MTTRHSPIDPELKLQGVLCLIVIGTEGDAVERCMERVCEAAHRLDERAAELMPNQPWGDIRGMGNRLRHAYDRISVDVIWNATPNDLPNLAVDARRALAELRAGLSEVAYILG